MANIGSSVGLSLGDHLRRLRGLAGLSQAEVARRIGLLAPYGQSHISQIEAGKSGGITFDTLARYVVACGTLPSAFLADAERAGLLDSIRSEVEARTGSGAGPAQVPATWSAGRELKNDSAAKPSLVAAAPAFPEQPQRIRRNERRKQDQGILHMLEAECAPVIRPHLAQSKVMRYGTFRWAMREFRSAWKVARAKSPGDETALRAELDQVVEKAVEYGLPRTGMEAVRDRAVELLMGSQGNALEDRDLE